MAHQTMAAPSPTQSGFRPPSWLRQPAEAVELAGRVAAEAAERLRQRGAAEEAVEPLLQHLPQNLPLMLPPTRQQRSPQKPWRP